MGLRLALYSIYHPAYKLILQGLDSSKEAEGRAQGTQGSSKICTSRESVSPLSREDQCEWHRMTRMTRPDCAVMCNLINTHTRTQINASGIE